MSNEKPTDEQIARDAAISICPISKPEGLREKWLDESESIILSAMHKANKRVIENVLPLVADLVKADIDARVEKGIETYGTPLFPHNGRDALRDAYEEAIDLAKYLRQALYERDGK